MSMVQEVKNLCEKKGLTVTRLEKEIGLGRGTITRWDTNSPSIDKVILVSNYFGVPVSSLVGEQETGQDADEKEKPTEPGELSLDDVMDLLKEMPREKLLDIIAEATRLLKEK